MGRSSYSVGKRQREADKARKKREKAERKAARKNRAPDESDIITIEELTGALPTIDEAMDNLSNRATASRPARSIPCRLFVGGLSWNTTDESLRAYFATCGPVEDAVVVTDRSTGRSRGFGFVTMESRKDAARAVEELDSTELDGRMIVVNVATERR